MDKNMMVVRFHDAINQKGNAMKLDNATVLVTGANRGLGLEFARQALARGAKKVYAGARDPASVTLAGVTPIRLDVTDPHSVAAAARELGDVDLVINKKKNKKIKRNLKYECNKPHYS
jgi:dTDP-4-dehydrorhamnose reductase